MEQKTVRVDKKSDVGLYIALNNGWIVKHITPLNDKNNTIQYVLERQNRSYYENN